MARKRHGAEEIITKLREAELMLSKGKSVPPGLQEDRSYRADLLALEKGVRRPQARPGQANVRTMVARDHARTVKINHRGLRTGVQWRIRRQIHPINTPTAVEKKRHLGRETGPTIVGDGFDHHEPYAGLQAP